MVAGSGGRWPEFRQVTADVVCVRLHGSEKLPESGYTDNELNNWAEILRGWLSGSACPDGREHSVYVYFDNNIKVHAPFNAVALAERLGTCMGPGLYPQSAPRA